MTKAIALAAPIRKVWSLEATCPVCGRVTRHGGGSTDREPVYGYRVCHYCQWQIELIPAQPAAKAGRQSSKYAAGE
jgi:hypothetical protein